MCRELLHEVRDVLRAADAIASEREFCEPWLSRSECCMRTLRFSTAQNWTQRLEKCAVSRYITKKYCPNLPAVHTTEV
jgi:hypothetical protein